jgi:hypothetical protein
MPPRVIDEGLRQVVETKPVLSRALPHRIPGHTVSAFCLSAITYRADVIFRGQLAAVGIAASRLLEMPAHGLLYLEQRHDADGESGFPSSLSTFAIFFGPMLGFIALLCLPWARPHQVLSKG